MELIVDGLARKENIDVPFEPDKSSGSILGDQWMPMSPANIAFNTGSLPLWAQTFIVTLDSALSSGWDIGVHDRSFQFGWLLQLGGWDSAKLTTIDDILKMYRDRGWCQAKRAVSSTLTNSTTLTLVFSW